MSSTRHECGCVTVPGGPLEDLHRQLSAEGDRPAIAPPPDGDELKAAIVEALRGAPLGVGTLSRLRASAESRLERRIAEDEFNPALDSLIVSGSVVMEGPFRFRLAALPGRPSEAEAQAVREALTRESGEVPALSEAQQLARDVAEELRSPNYADRGGGHDARRIEAHAPIIGDDLAAMGASIAVRLGCGIDRLPLALRKRIRDAYRPAKAPAGEDAQEVHDALEYRIHLLCRLIGGDLDRRGGAGALLAILDEHEARILERVREIALDAVAPPEADIDGPAGEERAPAVCPKSDATTGPASIIGIGHGDAIEVGRQSGVEGYVSLSECSEAIAILTEEQARKVYLRLCDLNGWRPAAVVDLSHPSPLTDAGLRAGWGGEQDIREAREQIDAARRVVGAEPGESLYHAAMRLAGERNRLEAELRQAVDTLRQVREALGVTDGTASAARAVVDLCGRRGRELEEIRAALGCGPADDVVEVAKRAVEFATSTSSQALAITGDDLRALLAITRTLQGDVAALAAKADGLAAPGAISAGKEG